MIIEHGRLCLVFTRRTRRFSTKAFNAELISCVAGELAIIKYDGEAGLLIYKEMSFPENIQ